MSDSNIRSFGGAVPILVLAGGLGFASPNTTLAASLPVERTVMNNGLVVLVSPQPMLPILTVRAIIRAGAILDPVEKPGTAHLVADLLDEGTSKRTSVQIADAIDFIGGKLETTGGGDWATASLTVLKDDMETGFSIFSDILQDPSFPRKEVERRRQQILGTLVSEKDQPGMVGRRAFDELVFGTHPYHRPVQGTEESLPKISRGDLVEFYQKYYRPNNTILAIVGDVTHDESMGMVETYFGQWSASPIQDADIPPAPVLGEKVVKLIDRDLVQANIILGHLGIDRKNPDYYSVQVMNYILGGGGFSSRLLMEVRDNLGLAYSIQSRFGAGAHPGSFSTRLQTNNSSAQVAIDAVISEIEKIRSHPVSDSELEVAKSFLIGSFPLRMDTSQKIANLITQIEYFGLGLDYVDAYNKQISSVSKEDVQRAAQTYLDPERYVLVVVANQKEANIRLAQEEDFVESTQ